VILGALPELSGIEVFPKAERLEGKRVGNLVRGPLGVHQLSGERYPFVDPVSLRPVSQTTEGTIDYLGEAERVSAAQAAEQLATMLEERKRPPRRPPAVVDGQGGAQSDRVTIAQLKERIGDPYAFIAQYVELDEAGRGSCPLHPPDVHPSFAVDRSAGYWVCFHEVNPKTGKYLGGDAVEFYRRLRGLDHRGAIRELVALYPGRPTARRAPAERMELQAETTPATPVEESGAAAGTVGRTSNTAGDRGQNVLDGVVFE
jgi:hypothetical protein